MTTATRSSRVVKKKRRTKSDSLTVSNASILLREEGVYVFEDSDGEVKLKGTVDPSDVLSEIVKTVPVVTDILPRGCVYYERCSVKSGTKHIYLLEYEPGMMNIQYFDGSEDHTYRLSTPYLYFLVTIKETKSGISLSGDTFTFATKSRLESLSDKIYRNPLSNIYDSGYICWGHTPVNKSPKDTPATYARKCTNNFFNSTFNTDLRPSFPSEFDSYSAWESLSKTNPLFILESNLSPFTDNILDYWLKCSREV